MVKCEKRIHELEWEMNIGGVRQWKVEKLSDGRWLASGPHPYIKGITDEISCKKWHKAMSHANQRAKECAENLPGTIF